MAHAQIEFRRRHHHHYCCRGHTIHCPHPRLRPPQHHQCRCFLLRLLRIRLHHHLNLSNTGIGVETRFDHKIVAFCWALKIAGEELEHLKTFVRLI
ncbi:hypothetical protein LguiA_025690 [Lonicera macranthoides]